MTALSQLHDPVGCGQLLAMVAFAGAMTSDAWAAVSVLVWENIKRIMPVSSDLAQKKQGAWCMRGRRRSGQKHQH